MYLFPLTLNLGVETNNTVNEEINKRFFMKILNKIDQVFVNVP